MRRARSTIGLFLTMAVTSAGVTVESTPQEPTETERRLRQSFETASQGDRSFEHEALAGNLFVLRNGRSRSLVFVTPTGTVLVDTNRPGWGAALRAKIATLTERPVATIINTHSHGGHTSGNKEFTKAKDIIAHVNALAQMRIQKEFSDGLGLPNRTFIDQLIIGQGDDRIALFYFGRGHTNGDAWVLFPAARVLYTDVFIGREMPIIDVVNGGNGIEYAETLRKAADAFDGLVDRIVTGHGEMATMADLREHAEFCRSLWPLYKRGRRPGCQPKESPRPGPCHRSTAVTHNRRRDLVLLNVQSVFNEIR